MLGRLFWSVCAPVLPNPAFESAWSPQRKGLWAERVVARSLWLTGYSIREHRWLAKDRSDIDIVAANDHHLLFVEVKFRSRNEDGWEDVTDRKRVRHLAKSAGEYLRQSGQLGVVIRFDAFVVYPPAESARKAPFHRLENYLNPRTVPGWRPLSPCADWWESNAT